VEMVRIAGFVEIGRRRLRRRAGMGVIEPDHVEPLHARLAPAVDVIFRIDDEARRPIRDVSRTPHGRDLVAPAEQEAAALGGGRPLPRMPDDPCNPPPRHSHRLLQYVRPAQESENSKFLIPNSQLRASVFWMAMAMPIPPPTQSDATPYFSFRARSA